MAREPIGAVMVSERQVSRSARPLRRALFVCWPATMINKNLAHFHVAKRGGNLARAPTKQIQAMHKQAISQRVMMLQAAPALQTQGIVIGMTPPNSFGGVFVYR